GVIAESKKADLLVIEGTEGDPYSHLIDALENDILLVMINGKSRLAQQKIAVAKQDGQEVLLIGKTTYILDLNEKTQSGGFHPVSLSRARATLEDGLARIQALTKNHTLFRKLF